MHLTLRLAPISRPFKHVLPSRLDCFFLYITSTDTQRLFALILKKKQLLNVTQLGSTRVPAEAVSFWQADPQVSVFMLSDVPPEADTIESPGGEEGGEDTSPCTQFILPRRDFTGLWGSLVLEPGVKERLVDFAASSLRFSASGVQDHIISSNRMVLLHGPPVGYPLSWVSIRHACVVWFVIAVDCHCPRPLS